MVPGTDPLPASVFVLACALAMWRFAWSRVDVNAEAIVYIGFLRNRRFTWTDIAGFYTGSDGITLVSTSGKRTWLMPTKREARTSRRMATKSEALLERVIQYAPNPSDYELLSDSQ